jgi:hypothetical protein
MSQIARKYFKKKEKHLTLNNTDYQKKWNNFKKKINFKANKKKGLINNNKNIHKVKMINLLPHKIIKNPNGNYKVKPSEPLSNNPMALP